MMVNFNATYAPVAHSLIRAAENEVNKFTQYAFYWAAFNDIYSVISYTANNYNKVKRDKVTGEPILKTHCNVSIPSITRNTSEISQIHLALDEFNFKLKDDLIAHNNVEFFLYRVPWWKGQKIEFGYDNYKLNGVMKVGDTLTAELPIWSPIDIPAYNTYMANRNISFLQNFLAQQIVELLYTVRCNLAHGDKDPDDANDIQVIEKAIPLLKLIVSALTENP